MAFEIQAMAHDEADLEAADAGNCSEGPDAIDFKHALRTYSLRVQIFRRTSTFKQILSIAVL